VQVETQWTGLFSGEAKIEAIDALANKLLLILELNADHVNRL